MEIEDPERVTPEPSRARKGSLLPAGIAFVAGAAVAVVVGAMKDVLQEADSPQYLVLAVGAFGLAGTQLRSIARALYVGSSSAGLDERRKSSPFLLVLAASLMGLLLAGSLTIFIESFAPSASLRRMVVGGAAVAFSSAVLAAIVREFRR